MKLSQPAEPRPTGGDSSAIIRPTEGAHVLVVESDVGSSEAVCRHLHNMGFQVKAVSSGVSAVISARQNIPAAIFIAVQLRDVTGRELVSWFRANPRLAAVPMIAMHSLGEDRPAIEPGGFNARLKKPASASQIAQALQGACLRAS